MLLLKNLPLSPPVQDIFVLSPSVATNIDRGDFFTQGCVLLFKFTFLTCPHCRSNQLSPCCTQRSVSCGICFHPATLAQKLFAQVQPTSPQSISNGEGDRKHQHAHMASETGACRTQKTAAGEQKCVYLVSLPKATLDSVVLGWWSSGSNFMGPPS